VSFRTGVAVSLIALGWAAATRAQDSKINTNLGMGVSVPLNPIAPYVGASANAVVGVGYNDADKRFIVRNSWNTTWGLKGYCMMPYSYLTDTNLADDFWTIQTTA